MPVKESLLVYIHIPKTAGTSFSKIMTENVGKPYIYHGLREFFRSHTPRDKVIHGHMSYGIHWLMRRPAIYFTLLRDPVEQCISYYYSSRNWKGQPGYEDARRYDLETFYQLRRYQNIQTHYLGGLLPSKITYNIPQAVLFRNAKKRLGRDISFGIVERYEESVRRLCDKFGWEKRPILNTRHAHGRPSTNTLPFYVIESLKRSNQVDVDLYAYAFRLFDRGASLSEY